MKDREDDSATEEEEAAAEATEKASLPRAVRRLIAVNRLFSVGRRGRALAAAIRAGDILPEDGPSAPEGDFVTKTLGSMAVMRQVHELLQPFVEAEQEEEESQGLFSSWAAIAIHKAKVLTARVAWRSLAEPLQLEVDRANHRYDALQAKFNKVRKQYLQEVCALRNDSRVRGDPESLFGRDITFFFEPMHTLQPEELSYATAVLQEKLTMIFESNPKVSKVVDFGQVENFKEILLNSELDKIRDTLMKKVQELSEMREERRRLQRELAQLSSAKGQKEGQSSVAGTAIISNLEERLRQAQDQQRETEGALNTATQRAETLTTERTNLSKDLRSATTEADNLRDEVARLTEELRSSQIALREAAEREEVQKEHINKMTFNAQHLAEANNALRESAEKWRGRRMSSMTPQPVQPAEAAEQSPVPPLSPVPALESPQEERLEPPLPEDPLDESPSVSPDGRRSSETGDGRPPLPRPNRGRHEEPAATGERAISRQRAKPEASPSRQQQGHTTARQRLPHGQQQANKEGTSGSPAPSAVTSRQPQTAQLRRSGTVHQSPPPQRQRAQGQQGEAPHARPAATPTSQPAGAAAAGKPSAENVEATARSPVAAGGTPRANPLATNSGGGGSAGQTAGPAAASARQGSATASGAPVPPAGTPQVPNQAPPNQRTPNTARPVQMNSPNGTDTQVPSAQAQRTVTPFQSGSLAAAVRQQQQQQPQHYDQEDRAYRPQAQPLAPGGVEARASAPRGQWPTEAMAMAMYEDGQEAMDAQNMADADAAARLAAGEAWLQAHNTSGWRLAPPEDWAVYEEGAPRRTQAPQPPEPPGPSLAARLVGPPSTAVSNARALAAEAVMAQQGNRAALLRAATEDEEFGDEVAAVAQNRPSFTEAPSTSPQGRFSRQRSLLTASPTAPRDWRHSSSQPLKSWEAEEEEEDPKVRPPLPLAGAGNAAPRTAPAAQGSRQFEAGVSTGERGARPSQSPPAAGAPRSGPGPAKGRSGAPGQPPGSFPPAHAAISLPPEALASTSSQQPAALAATSSRSPTASLSPRTPNSIQRETPLPLPKDWYPVQQHQPGTASPAPLASPAAPASRPLASPQSATPPQAASPPPASPTHGHPHAPATVLPPVSPPAAPPGNDAALRAMAAAALAEAPQPNTQQQPSQTALRNPGLRRVSSTPADASVRAQRAAAEGAVVPGNPGEEASTSFMPGGISAASTTTGTPMARGRMQSEWGEMLEADHADAPGPVAVQAQGIAPPGLGTHGQQNGGTAITQAPASPSGAQHLGPLAQQNSGEARLPTQPQAAARRTPQPGSSLTPARSQLAARDKQAENGPQKSPQRPPVAQATPQQQQQQQQQLQYKPKEPPLPPALAAALAASAAGSKGEGLRGGEEGELEEQTVSPRPPLPHRQPLPTASPVRTVAAGQHLTQPQPQPQPQQLQPPLQVQPQAPLPSPLPVSATSKLNSTDSCAEQQQQGSAAGAAKLEVQAQPPEAETASRDDATANVKAGGHGDETGNALEGTRAEAQQQRQAIQPHWPEPPSTAAAAGVPLDTLPGVKSNASSEARARSKESEDYSFSDSGSCLTSVANAEEEGEGMLEGERLEEAAPSDHSRPPSTGRSNPSRTSQARSSAASPPPNVKALVDADPWRAKLLAAAPRGHWVKYFRMNDRGDRGFLSMEEFIVMVRNDAGVTPQDVPDHALRGLFAALGDGKAAGQSQFAAWLRQAEADRSRLSGGRAGTKPSGIREGDSPERGAGPSARPPGQILRPPRPAADSLPSEALQMEVSGAAYFSGEDALQHFEHAMQDQHLQQLPSVPLPGRETVVEALSVASEVSMVRRHPDAKVRYPTLRDSSAPSPTTPLGVAGAALLPTAPPDWHEVLGSLRSSDSMSTPLPPLVSDTSLQDDSNTLDDSHLMKKAKGRAKASMGAVGTVAATLVSMANRARREGDLDSPELSEEHHEHWSSLVTAQPTPPPTGSPMLIRSLSPALGQATPVQEHPPIPRAARKGAIPSPRLRQRVSARGEAKRPASSLAMF